MASTPTTREPHGMAAILGPDLGKSSSLACLYDPETTETGFIRVDTDRADLRTLHTR